MKAYDAIVIGAGLNGLTAAALLARAGWRILVIEQHNEVGGLAGPGILHDHGSLCTKLLAGLRLQDHGLELTRTAAPLHAATGAGERVTLSAEAPAGGLSPDDAEGYRQYRAVCSRTVPLFRKLLLRPVPQRKADFLMLLPCWRSAAARELLHLAPLSAKDFLDQFFVHDALKAALAVPSLQAMYGGPFAPFGALAILMHEAMRGQHVVGGLPALAGVLHEAAASHGVKTRTSTQAEEILVSKAGQACGVRLATGETIATRMVAAACSPKEVFGSLLRFGAQRHMFAWRTRHLRGRGTTAHMVLDAAAPALLPCTRIAPGLEALERSFDRLKRGELPDTFALEIAAGRKAAQLSVLAHCVPYRPKGGWTDAARSELTGRVMEQLLPHLPSTAQVSQLRTPADLENEYRIPGGHCYHLEQAPDQLLVRPVPNFASPVAGLFFCGSGAHPSGSVTCAPGALAARAMAAYQKPLGRLFRNNRHI